MTINQLFYPCLSVPAIVVLVYFVWSLCQIVALSDQIMEEK